MRLSFFLIEEIKDSLEALFLWKSFLEGCLAKNVGQNHKMKKVYRDQTYVFKSLTRSYPLFYQQDVYNEKKKKKRGR
jgi:hypothetical protein